MANIIKIIFIVMIFSSCFILSGCENLCSNEKISETYSLSGEYSAIVFKRDCGATTAYSYHLSITKRGEEIKGSDTGNVVTGKSEMVAHWVNDKEIRVTLNNKQRAIKTEKQFEDITIVYD